MRKTVTMMACLSIALMPHMACSGLDQDDTTGHTSNSLAIKNKTGQNSLANRNATDIDLKYVYDSSMALVDEIQKNETLLNSIRNPTENQDGSIQYVDRNTLDYMLNYIGYTDALNLNQVNNIAAEVIKLNDIGAEEYFESSTNFSESAKVIVKDFGKADRMYNNVEDYPEFNQLTKSEQEMFRTASSLAAMSRGGIDDPTVGYIYLSCIAVGAVIGGSAGLVGGLIGAGVGLVVGCVCAIIYKSNNP